MNFTEKIENFLKLNKIAVTGVSSGTPDAANAIFKKFRDNAYTVYPVNPRTDHIEGDTCYPNLSDIPVKLEGVVVASPPSSARSIVDECLKLNIRHIWFHSSINQGSLDEKAAGYAEENGMVVISTGCPLMYLTPVDFGHKCIKWILGLTGKVPRK